MVPSTRAPCRSAGRIAAVNRAGPNPFPFAETWEFSQSVVCDGELVFTAGQGGFGEDGSVVGPDDFEAQLRQAYANLSKTLESVGASLDTVVKMTIFLARAEDYDTFKRVRHELFSAPFPASTAVLAGFLFDGMLVEMEAVARVGERRT
jgi:enamine deaminase RidA (YjgF/YER057c/UK114 family)